tara:strand:+ start:1451 stop:1855 length:405 start_codon:yes stop_codon:yes gene_type:complete
MSNSNFDNFSNRKNPRRRNNNDSYGVRKDAGGFRIRLSDNEMKAVKSIQETFQLRSTVAVLGFSVRTLSEMIKDENLIESITKYAKNNQNSFPTRGSQTHEETTSKMTPDPFARPLKSTSNDEIKPNKVKEDEK